MNPTPTESQLTENDFSAEHILLSAIKSFYAIYTQPHMTQMMYGDLRASVLPMVEKYMRLKFSEARREYTLEIYKVKQATQLDFHNAAMNVKSKDNACLDTLCGIVERACKGKHYGSFGQYNEEVIQIFWRLHDEYNPKPSNPE